MPTIAQILAKVRGRLNEATARFYQDSAVSGLMGWYSDGASEQHRIVVEMARQAERLGELQHPYIRHFAKIHKFNVVEITRLYAFPADFVEKISGSLSNVAADSVTGFDDEKFAQWLNSDADWMTRRFPQMQAVYDRPSFSFQIDPDTGVPMLEVFVHGNQQAPAQPYVGRLYYIRDVARVADLSLSSNVDLPDPFNDGPVYYAAAQAILQRGGDPSPYLDLAEKKAQNILGPPAASSATGGVKQAEGATIAVGQGATRGGL